MSNLLYIVAIFLIILWGLGYFIYNTGAIIHILLLIAAIAVLLDITKRRQA